MYYELFQVQKLYNVISDIFIRVPSIIDYSITEELLS